MMKQLFSSSDLDRWMEIFQENAQAKLIRYMKLAGEEFVKLARENGSYDNQTENLRSSIGYVVTLDGKILIEDFQVVGSGQEGVAKARQLALNVAGKMGGIVLIGVAGMEYAAAVESKGFEVISNSSLLAEQFLKKAIQDTFAEFNQ
jgi:hypothetical protein